MDWIWLIDWLDAVADFPNALRRPILYVGLPGEGQVGSNNLHFVHLVVFINKIIVYMVL